MTVTGVVALFSALSEVSRGIQSGFGRIFAMLITCR